MAARKEARAKVETAGESLSRMLQPLVKPASARAGKARLADLRARAAEDGSAAALAAALTPGAESLLAGIMDNAPFLRSLILDDPARLVELLTHDPETHHAGLVTAARQAWRGDGIEAVMAELRRLRAASALLIALADLGGAWDVDTVMAALTAFADAALASAAALALLQEHQAGAIGLPDLNDPQRGSGWILLAMGKGGAGELNYSSDIDLISFYDPAAAQLAEAVEPSPFYARLTRKLVRILSEYTADGYVLRTDLRLRPDPGSTPVAISRGAALAYYESAGQNWERAALIKARPAAGDIAAGEALLAELAPFIWRKYLDYAAIADIHSIKRQIHDHRGHASVAVAGHNLKLGRGGIREIEFFVQTQQLIAGGRNPSLRGRRTLDMLAALAREGWIAAEAAEALSAAYRSLRGVEHRLQMVADEQTHTLPEDPEALAGIARLCGLATAARLDRWLRPILESVQEHYARLFESAPSLTTSGGSLVFTGDEDDPETLETLSRLGYRNPAEVTRTVRAWHFGRYPAMRSATARELLTEITPALLDALAGTDNADAAFLAFDRFLGRLPAGVQLFALLGSNPALLRLLATILGSAPRLAETIVRRAHVVDAVLEPHFFGTVPDRDTLAERLEATLAQAVSYEDVLDRARIFGDEQSFLIGVRLVAGTIDARRAGVAFADLADLLVAELFARVGQEFENAHGRLPGGEAALIAMGKFGGREMTAASDLDLILLYDMAPDAAGSDGPRPLTPSQYYARLTQRLVAALSAPTAEGSLYEVDFRLRPSGHAGPLATSIDAFAAYQARDAWTWEHMALTRARPIAGDAALVARAGEVVGDVLRQKRPEAKLKRDVVEMRGLVEAEKGGEGPWDLKQAPGGIVDIEFIAQYLALRHGGAHPEILSVETEAVLAAAARLSLLQAGAAAVLLPALRLYQNLTQILRLSVTGLFDPQAAPAGLLRLLARAGEMPDFATLDAHLRDTEAAVRAVFVRILGAVPTEAPPERV